MIVICISTQEKQEDSVHGRLPEFRLFRMILFSVEHRIRGCTNRKCCTCQISRSYWTGNNEVCEMIIRRTLQHIELFAGIGGFRTAMDILGRDKIARFKHVGYSEIDRKAVQTYCANYDTENEVVMGDIVHFTESVERIGKLPNFDLLTGGFPCQTFSMMGHQRGFDDERGLMFFVLWILSVLNIHHTYCWKM